VSFVLPELDERDREEQRYAVYAIRVSRVPRGNTLEHGEQNRRELFATPDPGGIGVGLITLREEGDITDDTRIGILDRVERKWIVNPWAKGTL
jgi:hypothetical protein